MGGETKELIRGYPHEQNKARKRRGIKGEKGESSDRAHKHTVLCRRARTLNVEGVALDRIPGQAGAQEERGLWGGGRGKFFSERRVTKKKSQDPGPVDFEDVRGGGGPR